MCWPGLSPWAWASNRSTEYPACRRKLARSTSSSRFARTECARMTAPRPAVPRMSHPAIRLPESLAKVTDSAPREVGGGPTRQLAGAERTEPRTHNAARPATVAPATERRMTLRTALCIPSFRGDALAASKRHRRVSPLFPCGRIRMAARSIQIMGDPSHWSRWHIPRFGRAQGAGECPAGTSAPRKAEKPFRAQPRGTRGGDGGGRSARTGRTLARGGSRKG